MYIGIEIRKYKFTDAEITEENKLKFLFTNQIKIY